MKIFFLIGTLLLLNVSCNKSKPEVEQQKEEATQDLNLETEKAKHEFNEEKSEAKKDYKEEMNDIREDEPVQKQEGY